MPEKSAGSSKISQTSKSLNLFKSVNEIISGGSFRDEGGQGYVSYGVIRCLAALMRIAWENNERTKLKMEPSSQTKKCDI